ncbi:MAG TPA: hypothetical protein VN840_04435 [Streptosporangiaceae bacterium]|nr:hypothetical protein [Streptosporangiaceae bacterium]
MSGSISTSLTTGDVRTYVYPQDTAYIMDSRDDAILYTLDLAPRESC